MAKVNQVKRDLTSKKERKDALAKQKNDLEKLIDSIERRRNTASILQKPELENALADYHHSLNKIKREIHELEDQIEALETELCKLENSNFDEANDVNSGANYSDDYTDDDNTGFDDLTEDNSDEEAKEDKSSNTDNIIEQTNDLYADEQYIIEMLKRQRIFKEKQIKKLEQLVLELTGEFGVDDEVNSIETSLLKLYGDTQEITRQLEQEKKVRASLRLNTMTQVTDNIIEQTNDLYADEQYIIEMLKRQRIFKEKQIEKLEQLVLELTEECGVHREINRIETSLLKLYGDTQEITRQLEQEKKVRASLRLNTMTQVTDNIIEQTNDLIQVTDNIIQVSFYIHEDATKQFKEEFIRCSDRIKEFREAVEIILELKNPQKYRLILERNGKYLKILDDYKTFESENVIDFDKLVYLPFDSLPDSVFFPNQQLVTYTLTMTIPGVSPNPQYSIHLNDLCKNNPKTHYFNNSDINGRLKFEKFLQEKLQKHPDRAEIDEIIESWCYNICQGHLTTTLPLQDNLKLLSKKSLRFSF
ncbi:hypothetical protein IQ259_21725 [Fortiea sp. LEGE XX443]|uniref:hypothetical protein n=1 Tax=Fortiea sp. LEGE XX443 TaxID=1828611 RepID=UPI00187F35F6|nr:hypothetical protein [Fortiea sp. LEGE XX443]MBE9007609.1 hypothetical protein [Fortiea sp. LEGE XX443]